MADAGIRSDETMLKLPKSTTVKNKSAANRQVAFDSYLPPPPPPPVLHASRAVAANLVTRSRASQLPRHRQDKSRAVVAARKRAVLLQRHDKCRPLLCRSPRSRSSGSPEISRRRISRRQRSLSRMRRSRLSTVCASGRSLRTLCGVCGGIYQCGRRYAHLCSTTGEVVTGPTCPEFEINPLRE